MSKHTSSFILSAVSVAFWVSGCAADQSNKSDQDSNPAIQTSDELEATSGTVARGTLISDGLNSGAEGGDTDGGDTDGGDTASDVATGGDGGDTTIALKLELEDDEPEEKE